MKLLDSLDLASCSEVPVNSRFVHLLTYLCPVERATMSKSTQSVSTLHCTAQTMIEPERNSEVVPFSVCFFCSRYCCTLLLLWQSEDSITELLGGKCTEYCWDLQRVKGVANALHLGPCKECFTLERGN